jgi:hypothetical protein
LFVPDQFHHYINIYIYITNKNYRNPDWESVIIVPSISAGDTIVISMSNGGMVKLTYDFLNVKAEDDGIPFEVTIQQVSLASSLKLTASLEDTSLG